MALELSKNRTVNILVFSSILGMLAMAVSLWYASDTKAHINGGSLLASSEKHGVVFSMDKSFYRTDNDARVLNVASFKEMGLQPPLADVAFSEDALYVIEASRHLVKKCTITLSGCEYVGSIPGAKSTLAMDIAITPDNQHYYVSNSSLHRVDKFTIDGEHLYKLKMGESLKYPNDIYAISNTVLAVADSVNERVIGVKDGEPKGRSDNSRIIWQLNVEKKMGDLGLDWPAALSFSPNGRLWVNNQNFYFDVGEIVVYDAIDFSFLDARSSVDGKKIIVKYDSTVVPLNEGAQPRNFAAIKDFMVIGNFSPIELLKIDELSLGYGSFLDGILHNKFLELSNSRDYWVGVETLSKYAIGFFVLILLYGAYLETKENKKRQDDEVFNDNVEPNYVKKRDMTSDDYIVELNKDGTEMLDSHEVIMNEENSKQLRFQCNQKLFQEIHYVGITILFIISMIDIIGITELHIRMLFFQALALVPPIFAYKLAIFLKNGLFECITFQVTSYLTLSSGLIAWSLYALSGPSDPDTAGHMHILFFPIMHGLSIGIWIIVGMLVVAVYKLSVHDK